MLWAASPHGLAFRLVDCWHRQTGRRPTSEATAVGDSPGVGWIGVRDDGKGVPATGNAALPGPRAFSRPAVPAAEIITRTHRVRISDPSAHSQHGCPRSSNAPPTIAPHPRALSRPPAPAGSARACVKNVLRHDAVSKMKGGPSESACRSRLQTAVSCWSRKGAGGEGYGKGAA
jgi:hypothetical protein